LTQDRPFCCVGEGELVEQVLGQQTAENRESLLDDLIRQLQNEQDGRQIAEEPAPDVEGVFQWDFFLPFTSIAKTAYSPSKESS